LFYSFDCGATVLTLEDPSSELGTDFTCSCDCAGDRDELADCLGPERADRADEGEFVEGYVERFCGRCGWRDRCMIVFRLVFFDELVKSSE